MKKIAIVYTSNMGHTKQLAEQIKIGAEEAGAAVTLIDGKEVERAWNTPDEGVTKQHMEAINVADVVVFGSPTHMGTIAWEMKKFMDSLVPEYMGQTLSGKYAAGFTHSSNVSGDKQTTFLSFQTMAAQLGMYWVPLRVPVVRGDRDDEKALNRLGYFAGLGADSAWGQDTIGAADAATARAFGENLAKM